MQQRYTGRQATTEHCAGTTPATELVKEQRSAADQKLIQRPASSFIARDQAVATVPRDDAPDRIARACCTCEVHRKQHISYSAGTRVEAPAIQQVSWKCVSGPLT